MRLQYIFLFLLLGTVISCQLNKTTHGNEYKTIHRPYKTTSPFINKLSSLNNKELKTEVEKFWSKYKITKSLPLIEKDPLDKAYNYLTFIYQDSLKHSKIKFDIIGVYGDTRLGNKQLRQLKNTDLYFRTYKMPKDICFAYKYIITDLSTNTVNKEIDPLNKNIITPKNKYSYSYVDFNKNDRNLVELNSRSTLNFDSKIDTLSYTDKIVNKDRNIYIYLPPNYDKYRTKDYPVIYLFDAFIYLNRIEVPNILDNLILKGEIEPVVAVFFGTYKKSREKLLALNVNFKNEFITNVIPMIRQHYNVSSKPEKNIIGGISYGGLAANYFAFENSDYFGKVLSQSGSLWRGKKLLDNGGNWIREDWLIKCFQTQEKRNIKLFLDWGLQENWVLGSNRKYVDVLKFQKYDYKFIEFNGWHDWTNSRKTFSVGLKYLLEK